MKKVLLNACLLAILLISLNSCDEPLDASGGPLSLSGDVPSEVLDYVALNFPNYGQQKAKREDICDDTLVFEVEVEDGPGPDIDLYFKADGSFWFQGVEIPFDSLPAAVVTALEGYSSDYSLKHDDIERWEISADSILFEIELESAFDDLELLFTASGALICSDSDDNDDDDNDDKDGDDDDNDGDDNDKDGDDDNDGDNDNDGDDNSSDNIPSSVREFINQNYPSYRIEETEKEDICDDDYYYEVELEDGSGPDLDLYFSLDWTFQFVMTEISAAQLSDAVKAVLDKDYANYQIESDDIYRLEWQDGSLKFEIELEGDDDDLEIIFNEDGSIYCLDD